MSRLKLVCALLSLLTLVVTVPFVCAQGRRPDKQANGSAAAEPDDPAYLLWTRGYPKATPLAQAVEDFNQRLQRTQVGKTQPPLTEEEVLAAIRDMRRGEDEIPPYLFERLQLAAKGLMLPKGSYFSFLTGTVSFRGYDIDALNIYLQLGLDKYHADLVGVPSFSHLIRRQYISSRPTSLKSPR
jgi:hypothetical protein